MSGIDTSEFYKPSNRFAEDQEVKVASRLEPPDEEMNTLFGHHRLVGRMSEVPGRIISQALQLPEYWFVRHDDGSSAVYRPSELEEMK